MKLGLALAGGGVKGAAHIGVLKVLEEEGISIKYVGGTSSGSIVASLYAMGFTADEIYKIFKKYCKKIKYVDLLYILKAVLGLIFTGKIIIDGLNSGKQIEKLVDKFANKKGIYNISDIKNNLPEMIRPEDFKKLENSSIIYDGLLKNYQSSAININEKLKEKLLSHIKIEGIV